MHLGPVWDGQKQFLANNNLPSHCFYVFFSDRLFDGGYSLLELNVLQRPSQLVFILTDPPTRGFHRSRHLTPKPFLSANVIKDISYYTEAYLFLP